MIGTKKFLRRCDCLKVFYFCLIFLYIYLDQLTFQHIKSVRIGHFFALFISSSPAWLVFAFLANNEEKKKTENISVQTKSAAGVGLCLVRLSCLLVFICSCSFRQHWLDETLFCHNGKSRNRIWNASAFEKLAASVTFENGYS